jgi:hypothetical protein
MAAVDSDPPIAPSRQSVRPPAPRLADIARRAWHIFGWGFCGWMNFTPQQARLITIEPAAGPLVLSLNNSMNCLGSAIGALTQLRNHAMVAGRHPAFYVLAIVTFEVSHRLTPAGDPKL